MDLQSLWLTNHSILDKMEDLEYKSKEQEIIESLFGGTRNMIKIMLKKKNNLSYIQQKELFKILKKPKQNKIKKEMNVNENGEINLSSLNSNCLASIFIFLTPYERGILSTMCRMFCVAAQFKKSYPNSQILQFPLNKVYHFIHKISEIKEIDNNANNNDLLKLMHESELLCLWIKNENQFATLEPIATSGILPTFSNLLLNQHIIKHHIKFIANILFLFKALSEIPSLRLSIVNVNIIENLAIFINDSHIFATQDTFTQHEVIPHIVTIIHNLYSQDFHIRVQKSYIIHRIICVLQSQWTKNTKDLSWIISALNLACNWMHCAPMDHYGIIKKVIPQFINKISALIDVQNSKEWIYNLLSPGNAVIISDPDQPPRIHTDIHYVTSDDYVFTVAQIIELPSRNDSDPMITLLGKFKNATNPQQKLCVELKRVHIQYLRNRRGIYGCMLAAFESLCDLLSVYRQYNNIDFKSNQYAQITNGIKRILQVSQTQFPDVSHVDIFLDLLESDWDFFMHLIPNEIQTQFMPDPRAYKRYEKLYTLIDAAFDCHKLDSLCKVEWFRQSFSRPFGRNNEVYPDSLPKHWNEYILTGLLKNFCGDYRSYCHLSAVVHKLDCSTMDYQYFIEENGISSLLQIISTVVKPEYYEGPISDICQIMLGNSKLILSNVFVYLSDNRFGEEVFWKYFSVEIFRGALQSVLSINRDNGKPLTNEKLMKMVLEQMERFLGEQQAAVLNIA